MILQQYLDTDLLWMMIDVITMCIYESYNIPPHSEVYVLCANLFSIVGFIWQRVTASQQSKIMIELVS